MIIRYQKIERRKTKTEFFICIIQSLTDKSSRRE